MLWKQSTQLPVIIVEILQVKLQLCDCWYYLIEFKYGVDQVGNFEFFWHSRKHSLDFRGQYWKRRIQRSLVLLGKNRAQKFLISNSKTNQQSVINIFNSFLIIIMYVPYPAQNSKVRRYESDYLIKIIVTLLYVIFQLSKLQ
jgi:hypothetical protein